MMLPLRHGCSRGLQGGSCLPVAIEGSRKRLCSAPKTTRNFREPRHREAPVFDTFQGKHRACRCAAAAAAAAQVAGQGSTANLAAVVLGWGVVAGSWFRSVPQILRILRNDSAEGLSVTANIVELLCYTVIVGYNVNHMYPFSSYGDVFACWLQDIVVTALIVRHLKLPAPTVVLATLLFAASSYWVISGSCGLQVLVMLQVGASLAMSFGARIPQIMLNSKRGDTGELSLISTALSVAGCLVRVFTTIVLTADALLLASTVVQTLLNGILLYQCVQTEFSSKRGSLRVQNA